MKFCWAFSKVFFVFVKKIISIKKTTDYLTKIRVFSKNNKHWNALTQTISYRFTPTWDPLFSTNAQAISHLAKIGKNIKCKFCLQGKTLEENFHFFKKKHTFFGDEGVIDGGSKWVLFESHPIETFPYGRSQKINNFFAPMFFIVLQL